MFVSCNVPEKNTVGKSVKNVYAYFWSKMRVLCIFYVDWELEGPQGMTFEYGLGGRLYSWLNANIGHITTTMRITNLSPARLMLNYNNAPVN